MSLKKTPWTAGDREKHLLVSAELRRLRKMSQALRLRAMRSFVRRTAAVPSAAEKPTPVVKPTSLAA
jgi:hypothetical protein